MVCGFGDVLASIIHFSYLSLIKWGNHSQIAKYTREKFQLYLLISTSGPTTLVHTCY